MRSPHKFQDVFVAPIKRLLESPEVSDIFINGDKRLYAIVSGRMQRQESVFLTEQHVRDFAQYWVGVGGRRLDEGIPCGDVNIHYNTCDMRFHAVLGVLSNCGTTISIRIHRKQTRTLKSMVHDGFLKANDAAALANAITSRHNILISGATGSGKTTLLNTLINSCPEQDRVVVVEDSSEIKTAHPHCINLHARQKNIENRGEITAEELIFQTLRMKPDRLIVGEFRGRETQSLLSAFNTGHSGFATIHANSINEVHDRLETLCLLAKVPANVAVKYAYGTFNTYVHMKQKDGICYIQGVREITKMPPSSLRES